MKLAIYRTKLIADCILQLAGMIAFAAVLPEPAFILGACSYVGLLFASAIRRAPTVTETDTDQIHGM